jgi:RHS repeat-associated protein
MLGLKIKRKIKIVCQKMRITPFSDGEAMSYTYNAVNQLLTVSGSENAVFDYDTNGNRWHAYAEATDLPPSPPPTDSGNHLLTESGDHLIVSDGDADDEDAGGEIPHGEQEELYEYDYENRLVKLTRTVSGNAQEYHYGYDYRTRRVLRNEGNGDETISFSGGTSVSEWGSAGSTPLVEYIRGSDYGGGIGGILYTFRNNVPSFTHYDARGDVTQKVNADGAVTYQAQYEAFGSRTKETGQTQDRQKANTKDEDPTGLLNEGYRYRDLKYGVFITKDPAGFIDGPNLYTYVKQNPWSKFDPKGLKFDDEQFDSEKNQMKNWDNLSGKQRDILSKNNQTQQNYDSQVSKFNHNLEKMRFTPTGSALYEKIKNNERMVNITLFENKNVASSVGRNSTNVSINTMEGITPGPLYQTLGHEFFHVHQNMNLLNGDKLRFDFPSPSGLTHEQYNKALDNAKLSFEKRSAERAVGDFPFSSSDDDFSGIYSMSNEAAWREQQAQRAGNVIYAEYQITSDLTGKTTPESLVGTDPSVREYYSNPNFEKGPVSLNGKPYGNHNFDKNP